MFDIYILFFKNKRRHNLCDWFFKLFRIAPCRTIQGHLLLYNSDSCVFAHRLKRLSLEWLSSLSLELYLFGIFVC